jgi:hypothetical protein
MVGLARVVPGGRGGLPDYSKFSLRILAPARTLEHLPTLIGGHNIGSEISMPVFTRMRDGVLVVTVDGDYTRR